MLKNQNQNKQLKNIKMKIENWKLKIEKWKWKKLKNLKF
jgi:hypothetical protein